MAFTALTAGLPTLAASIVALQKQPTPQTTGGASSSSHTAASVSSLGGIRRRGQPELAAPRGSLRRPVSCQAGQSPAPADVAGSPPSTSAPSASRMAEGLEINPDRNPKLSFGGVWLWLGPSMIHLMELPNPDPTSGRPEHGGRDRHACFHVQSVEPLKQALEAAGYKYSMSKSGRPALFVRDPDGNALEFSEF
eukprot:jgi/Mesen1/8093/ME000434S07344